MKPKLFCFTYAGGTSSFFDEIGKDLPDVDLIGLDYAGHGPRHKEPFYASFDELGDDLYQQIKKQITDENYAMFGYSMGSITLAEVLKRIIKGGNPLPTHVFLAAHEPHTKAELSGFSQEELDEYVKERTIRFGAVPKRLINNKTFWRTYLPLYRADYGIIGKYQFENLELKTEIPCTVFYSETDTPLMDMEEWKRFFIGECEFVRYEGQHFFIQKHHVEMAEVIKGRMNI